MLVTMNDACILTLSLPLQLLYVEIQPSTYIRIYVVSQLLLTNLHHSTDVVIKVSRANQIQVFHYKKQYLNDLLYEEHVKPVSLKKFNINLIMNKVHYMHFIF